MPNVNKVFLMGNLTRDIETRFTPSGTCVGSTGMAINRKYRDTKSNDIKEEVTFVDLTVFGKMAETWAKYFHKGSPVFVEGRLKYDQWEDKQSGQKRSKLGVVVDAFEFMGGKPGTAKAATPNSQEQGADDFPL